MTAPCENPPSTMRSHGTPNVVRDGVEERAERVVARVERVVVGVADARHDVPVPPARRELQRPARRDADEPPVGVEHVEERQQVVLVGAAAVQQDERARRLARGGPDDVGQGVRQAGAHAA